MKKHESARNMLCGGTATTLTLWGCAAVLAGCGVKGPANMAPDSPQREARARVMARGIKECRASSEATSSGAVPAWMIGCWRGEKGSQISIEQWRRDGEGVLRGGSETTRDGEVIHRETMTIERTGGGYRFIASPQGQPTATFAATVIGMDCIDFRNPEHDFPQLVGYRREGDRLMPFIAGYKNGEHEQVVWEWQKTECAPASADGA